MAEVKQPMSRHLGAARKWLSQAEEAFGRNRDIRGELDLFLAQAELQHAQEINRSQRWRYRYPLLRQGLAFGLALLVAAGGIGGAYWSLHQQGPVASTTIRESKGASSVPISFQQHSVPPLKQVEANATPVLTTTALPRQQPQQTPVAEAPVAKATEKVEKEVVLSPDEMQQLIRTAGKSLRGQ